MTDQRHGRSCKGRRLHTSVQFATKFINGNAILEPPYKLLIIRIMMFVSV